CARQGLLRSFDYW
nr:immunoglobulin heavy chain junction region [Mus musculus]